MQITLVSKATANFLNKLAAADVVVIDDDKFIITEKAAWAGEPITHKVEDHETILETDYTRITWWEVSNEIEQINDQQWKIGDEIFAFLAFAPV